MHAVQRVGSAATRALAGVRVVALFLWERPCQANNPGEFAHNITASALRFLQLLHFSALLIFESAPLEFVLACQLG
ncbi:hypothetical protein [Pseudoxanthomonas mexicana]|uniref:hypothetical protein n=1 Tax=Pseudoxanthomonas mexicana TaxID=128785 RepID=UPI00398B2DC0